MKQLNRKPLRIRREPIPELKPLLSCKRQQGPELFYGLMLPVVFKLADHLLPRVKVRSASVKNDKTCRENK